MLPRAEEVCMKVIHEGELIKEMVQHGTSNHSAHNPK